MAGIYIHIPFCKQACNYCNFHFSTNQKTLPQMVNAIISEAHLQKNYLAETVDTIYFGGGTPSLCAAPEIEKMILAFKKVFKVNEMAEITLETNPDDITEQKLMAWKQIGINRLSIGIQSFIDADLQWMNRAHNSTEALQSIELALAYFSNITIDLIYGTPTLSNEQWLNNIETVIALNIPHISCYALTVEPKTALQKLIEKNKLQNIDVEKQAQHFELLLNKLNKAGYEHYEISNFAKPNYRSKHNSSYWQGKYYLGLGPSAHSYNGISRQWNVANNSLYLNSIDQEKLPFEIEILTKTQQLNEYIMTALRTSEGISLQFVQEKFETAAKDSLVMRAQTHLNNELLIIENHFIQLTQKAKFLADGIAADLFV